MRRHNKMVPVSIFLITMASFLLAACASEPVVTPATQPTRDPMLEQRILQELGEIAPDAVPIYQEATIALDSGEPGKAKDLYEQVIEMAPEFAPAYRRLSYAEAYLSHLERAEELARKALELEPHAYNRIALASVLLQRDSPRDSQEAFNLASSAADSLPDDTDVQFTLLIAAATVNNLEVARQADDRLLALAPANPYAHYFAGLLDGNDGKWEKAEKELLLAQQLGMPAEEVQRILDSGVARNALLIRSLRWSAIAMGFWLLGFGALFAAGTLLSRATMRALETAEPRRDTQISPTERRIRSVYRAIITVLSLYFYISIPFVILTLFLVVGGAFYLFFLIGRIPIQLAFVLLAMLFISLYAIAKSLFSRIKDTPPGEQLGREKAPELWSLVEGVARNLGTRPVDAIYVTPFTGIAVNESGSILRKVRGAGKRNLILGMGALTGLSQGQLAAILAHEYGHFSHQDTAGGDLAHLVYTSLDQIAQSLIQAQSTQIYNPVWLFLMAYQRIFLRVTLGASRLQEVLADRYAAIAYGGHNFIDGLKSIIWQSIAFPLQADNEIRTLLESGQPLTNLSNLYDLQMRDKLKSDLEDQFDKAMSRSTSTYDSHPAPQERIQLVERLRLPYSSVADNRQPALELFPNPEILQKEMTAELVKNIRVINS